MILINKTDSDKLFKYILSVNFDSSWDMYYASKDGNGNPRVYFETKKWNKLKTLIDEYLENNEPIKYTDSYMNDCSIVNAFIGIKYRIKNYLKKVDSK